MLELNKKMPNSVKNASKNEDFELLLILYHLKNLYCISTSNLTLRQKNGL